jgi:hypothetical protein
MEHYKEWDEKIRPPSHQEQEPTLPPNIPNEDRGQHKVSRPESGGTQATSPIIPNGGGGHGIISIPEPNTKALIRATQRSFDIIVPLSSVR